MHVSLNLNELSVFKKNDYLDLRLQLLDEEHNCDLVKSLYGLLMLLPQTEAFHTLRKRLQCVPNFKLAYSTDFHA